MTLERRSGARSLLSLLALLAAGAVLAESIPTYTNARVLSFDVQSRLVRVRFPDGREQTAELDDNVTGFAGIAVGDSVILSLRREPGRPRVSRIVKGGASAAPEAAPSSKSASVTLFADGAETTYRERLAALGREADAVDRLWNGFKTPCKAGDGVSYEGGRPWLLLWDNPEAADLSGGFCRDLFNQIVDAGTTVENGVAAADEAARRSLTPEKMREIRRAQALDGVGSGRTPPKRLEP